MNTRLPLFRSSYAMIFSMIIIGVIISLSGDLVNSDIFVIGQLTNSSGITDADILANINQTYLSLIPLMIQEVQNTNASDIPIKQIMEATPSNATELQGIVKNNSDSTPTQAELNSTYDNASTTNTSLNNMPSKPQDLIPVVVNMTQNTNASNIPITNVLNTVPSNATELQGIVKNNSDSTPTQAELNSTYDNASTTNTSLNNMPSKPQDLIPVVVNMTQNTNASNIPITNVLNTVPSNATEFQDIVKNNSDSTPTQAELNSTYDNASTTNTSLNNMPSKPQDLIPVVVNMTQNTNASNLAIMHMINSTPGYDNLNIPTPK